MNLNGLKVLVVDDEALVREGMKVLLTSSGCEVELAETTGEALAAASANKPDIALVDYSLRDNDCGLDTIVQLRRLHPDQPAIIITGDTAPNRLLEIQNAGIDLLSKPVAVESLRNAIATACHTSLNRTGVNQPPKKFP